MIEKNYEELFNAILKKWCSRNPQIDFKNLCNISSEYICSIYEGSGDQLMARSYFLEEDNRLNPYSRKQKIDILYLLDLIFLFQSKVFEVSEYIEKYVNGSPMETFGGSYDFVYKLLFNNILISFENLVETYQKISKKIGPNEYKKENMSFEEVTKFDTESWSKKENIFKTINFLRKIYVHSEECKLKDMNNNKFVAILDAQIISFKNDLELKFSVYEENGNIIVQRSCTLNITNFLGLVYNEFFGSSTSWEEIFSKLKK